MLRVLTTDKFATGKANFVLCYFALNLVLVVKISFQGTMLILRIYFGVLYTLHTQ